jgi:hypothetical protein
MSAPGVTVVIDATSDDVSIPFALLREPRAVFAQRLSNRFSFWLAEWFLDLRLGAPFYERIFAEHVDPRIALSLLRNIVIHTPGCLRISKLEYVFDRKSRRLEITDLTCEVSELGSFVAQPQEFIVTVAG